LLQTFEMTFICKKCKKAFRKDAREMEDSDEYCPHCDNHYVLEAKTPKARLEFEGEDARIDARFVVEYKAK
jgi:DNA-directed RNA polymerase subunit RPC12/RpoP